MGGQTSAELGIPEPNPTISRVAVADKGGERWKQEAVYSAVVVPIVAFAALSGYMGATELTRMFIESLQTANIMPSLNELQMRLATDIPGAMGGVTGAVGGFVVGDQITKIPRIFRG